MLTTFAFKTRPHPPEPRIVQGPLPARHHHLYQPTLPTYIYSLTVDNRAPARAQEDRGC